MIGLFFFRHRCFFILSDFWIAENPDAIIWFQDCLGLFFHHYIMDHSDGWCLTPPDAPLWPQKQPHVLAPIWQETQNLSYDTAGY